MLKKFMFKSVCNKQLTDIKLILLESEYISEISSAKHSSVLYFNSSSNNLNRKYILDISIADKKDVEANLKRNLFKA